MTTTLIPGLSMCPADGCEGQLHRCYPDVLNGECNQWHCSAKACHTFHDDDLAACSRCDVPQNSDRETVAQALAGAGTAGEAWLLVEGEGLVCPEHLALCRHCGDPVLLEDARCAEGEHEYHCPDCGDNCPACARDAHDMQQYAVAKEGGW